MKPIGRRRLLVAVPAALAALILVVGGAAILSSPGGGFSLRSITPGLPAGTAADQSKLDGMSASGSGSGTSTSGVAVAPGEGSDPFAPVPAPDAVDGSLLVRTGTMELQVSSINDSLAAARTAITGLGGFISDSSQSAADYERPFATITYRVPAAKWDDALHAIRGLGGTVKAEKTGAVEVTGTVQDLGARITNLRAAESALVAIMAKAVKIEDVLAVQTQLTQVRGEIEQLSTEKARLERQAAYGTLSVTFSTPVVAVTEATQQWNPGAQIDQALAALIAVGQAFAGGLIWLAIVGIPVLVVAAAIWLGVQRVQRVLRRSSRGSAA